MELLKKGSIGPVPAPTERSWSLDFCQSPKAFNAGPLGSFQLGSVSVEKTSLMPSPFDIAAQAQGTGEIIDIPSSLAFRSIGYKSEALPGFADLGVPFNNQYGLIPNDMLGRVVDVDRNDSSFGTIKHIPGMYCAGWVKRGPTGVIASTMLDAFSTADAITEDWHSHRPFLGASDAKLGWEVVKHEANIQGCRRVSWDDWLKIDAAERARGEVKGKEREKFTNVDDMLAILD